MGQPMKDVSTVPTFRYGATVLLVASLLAAAAASCSLGGAPAHPTLGSFGASGAASGAGGAGGAQSGAPRSDAGEASSGQGMSADGGTGMGSLPFTADPPIVYLAKVKNVLVGLPPTDTELMAVEADPTALGSLVDGWMMLPQYQTKMLRFFELAFQQTQISADELSAQFADGYIPFNQGPWADLMVQNIQESFARTMLAITSSGQPFTQAMSTQTFALTTALRSLYALTDVFQLDDSLVCMHGLHDAFAAANPNLTLYATGSQIPLSETLDPTSANYMHWYFPDLSCPSNPEPFPISSSTLYAGMLGVFDGGQTPGCGGSPGLFTASDFSDWTMIEIRQPNPGEATSDFYDLPTLRGATQLVLQRPYLGFYTTPAFFANWQTNASNQMRVTLNQTLIVATGAQVDGTDPTTPTSTPGLDSAHAAPGSACFACHQLLDPTRSIFSKSFSWNYGFGLQDDPTFASQAGLFAFQGVQAPVATMYDFASVLASHPLVASGWAQKLCYYVNSVACDPTDPQFQSLVTLFQTSSYSWSQLVKAVVTSPITTHASATVTATTNGEIVAISRRDHLCAAWNARLGFTDICGLNASVKPVISGSGLNIIGGLPSDGYGRGSVAPVLPNQPTLFYRGATENLCEAIAAIVIDNTNPPTGAKTWSSSQPTAAITDFVNVVMGLAPSDPRASAAQTLLQSQFTASMQVSGTSATAALQSTFTAACMSPSAVSMGM
jgi:hypothetical protein